MDHVNPFKQLITKTLLASLYLFYSYVKKDLFNLVDYERIIWAINDLTCNFLF